MSFDSTATFPLTRRTPRKYRLKRKKRDSHLLEQSGANYVAMDHPDETNTYPQVWDEETVGYGNTIQNTTEDQPSLAIDPMAFFRVPMNMNQYSTNNYGMPNSQPSTQKATRGTAAKKKGKGKANANAKGDDNPFKANFYTNNGPTFSSAMTEYLLQLMLYEKQNPNRANGGVLHHSSMPTITAAINAKFNTTLTVKQVDTKRGRIKKEYSDFMKLKNKTTGMGWNHVLNIPVMSDDWWNNLAKADIECCMFRYETFPNFETLHKIFDGQVATGEYSTSSMGTALNTGSQGTAPMSCNPSCGVPFDLNGQPDDFNEPFLARLPLGKKPNKKQRSGGCDEEFMATLKSMQVANAAKTEVRLRRSSQGSVSGSLGEGPIPTLDQCMAQLCGMTGLDEYSFAQACVSFKDPFNRKVFISIPDEQLRRNWVNNHHSKAEPLARV